MSNDKVIPKNVSLYPQDWAIVQKVANSFPGGGNYSMGLRHIIREWQRLNEAEQAGNRSAETRGQEATK